MSNYKQVIPENCYKISQTLFSDNVFGKEYCDSLKLEKAIKECKEKNHKYKTKILMLENNLWEQRLESLTDREQLLFDKIRKENEFYENWKDEHKEFIEAICKEDPKNEMATLISNNNDLKIKNFYYESQFQEYINNVESSILNNDLQLNSIKSLIDEIEKSETLNINQAKDQITGLQETWEKRIKNMKDSLFISKSKRSEITQSPSKEEKQNNCSFVEDIIIQQHLNQSPNEFDNQQKKSNNTFENSQKKSNVKNSSSKINENAHNNKIYVSTNPDLSSDLQEQLYTLHSEKFSKNANTVSKNTLDKENHNVQEEFFVNLKIKEFRDIVETKSVNEIKVSTSFNDIEEANETSSQKHINTEFSCQKEDTIDIELNYLLPDKKVENDAPVMRSDIVIKVENELNSLSLGKINKICDSEMNYYEHEKDIGNKFSSQAISHGTDKNPIDFQKKARTSSLRPGFVNNNVSNPEKASLSPEIRKKSKSPVSFHVSRETSRTKKLSAKFDHKLSTEKNDYQKNSKVAPKSTLKNITEVKKNKDKSIKTRIMQNINKKNNRFTPRNASEIDSSRLQVMDSKFNSEINKNKLNKGVNKKVIINKEVGDSQEKETFLNNDVLSLYNKVNHSLDLKQKERMEKCLVKLIQSSQKRYLKRYYNVWTSLLDFKNKPPRQKSSNIRKKESNRKNPQAKIIPRSITPSKNYKLKPVLCNEFVSTMEENNQTGSQKNSAKQSPAKAKYDTKFNRVSSSNTSIAKNTNYVTRKANDEKYRKELQENLASYEVSQKVWLTGLISNKKKHCPHHI